VREAGFILSQAVLVAVAVDGEGRREVLGVDLVNRESRTSWRDFPRGLKERGLVGITRHHDQIAELDAHNSVPTAKSDRRLWVR
jgi:transposase-like protein